MDNTIEQPVVSDTESKRAARLTQLSSARESANTKKRQRDEDLSYIRDKISAIDQKINTVATEPVVDPLITVKKQKIITKQEDPPEPISESWSTALIRTTAVLSLGAASYWFQHRYGKPILVQKKAEITTQAPTKTILPVQDRAQSLLKVGASGFVQ